MKFKFIWEDDTGKKLNRQGMLKQLYLEKFYNPTDERDIQDRFIYEHVEDFFNLLERRYLQKILKDISYILDKKWASAIWEQDFYHGHISGKSKIAITNLDALLSPSNVCFLYHTYEQQTWIPEAINRNIISYPNEDPRVVHPNYEFGAFPGLWSGFRETGSDGVCTILLQTRFRALHAQRWHENRLVGNVSLRLKRPLYQ